MMPMAATQSSFAAALLHAELPVPDNITTGRGVPDAARFAVYRNNVFVSLTKTLVKRFPVTEQLVGSEFFIMMTRTYTQDHKPTSPLLMEYGADFPDFLAGFGPVKSLAYLPDVALIEAAWTRAHHAADAVPLDLAFLSGVAAQDLPGVRLVPHPSATLIRSRFPAGSIWAAHQKDEITPVAAHLAETVLVLRPALSVGVHILPPRDAEFAAALLSGQPVGSAAERALALHPEFDFGAALVGLITLGAFSALCLNEGIDL